MNWNLIRFLKGFGYFWLVLATFLVLIGLTGIWMETGFSEALEVFSLFNVFAFIAILVTVSPAIGAFMFAAHLENKQHRHL